MKKPAFLPEISDEIWDLWQRRQVSLLFDGLGVVFDTPGRFVLFTTTLSNNNKPLFLYEYTGTLQTVMTEWLWLIKYQPKLMKQIHRVRTRGDNYAILRPGAGVRMLL